VASPVSAIGATDADTIYTTQETLVDGRILVSTPVSPTGGILTDDLSTPNIKEPTSAFSTQKTLADGRTLVASPVSAIGATDADTIYTTQETLVDGRILVSTPVSPTGGILTDDLSTPNIKEPTTAFSTQKTLADGRTLVASPVSAIGATDADTIYTTQETLVDGRILVSTPVSPTGGILTDDLSTPNIKEPTTAFSTQKTLADGRTLVASPVSAIGATDADTIYTTQETLVDGRILVSTPVSPTGGILTDDLSTPNIKEPTTAFSTQKTLADGRTLVASPVSAIGATDADTIYTTQETLVDGRILVSTPVSPTGGILTDDLSTPNIKEPTTAFSTQKTLADGRTLVASPVSAIGATDADTIYTTQETLVDGRILVSTPVSPTGGILTDDLSTPNIKEPTTAFSTQKTLADGRTLVASPVSAIGATDADTIYTTQETLVDGRILVSTPVSPTGGILTDDLSTPNIKEPTTAFSTQKTLADGRTLVASPVSAIGATDADTIYTTQETLVDGRILVSTPVSPTGGILTDDLSTPNIKEPTSAFSTQKTLADGRTLVASPVSAIGATDADTIYTTQETLVDGRILVSTPVSPTGGILTDDLSTPNIKEPTTAFSTQKTLADGRTLVASPVSAIGATDADTIYTTQETLVDGRILVSTPVSPTGGILTDDLSTPNIKEPTTAFSTQKTLADGRTLVASPVSAIGATDADTIYTTQETLVDGRILVSTPVSPTGGILTDDLSTPNIKEPTTAFSTQKTLADGRTLVASPVSAIGATDADTIYTTQETLVDGRILVSTPVSPTGGILTDDLSTPNIKEPTTAFSTQKTLADGRTLVASPVSAIGATDADTIYTTQETLVDGRILVSTPVSPNGSFIPGETGHTVQKALSPTKTLIKTPVDEFGNFIPDVTEYSTQETINSTTTLIARPVDVNGDIIFEATEFSLQISTLDPKVTLIASPVSETGVIDGDTFYTRQEDLGANKTFISTPVESSGAFKTNTAHSLQERVGAVESLILTNVDAVTKAGTSTTQTIYAQDTDDDLRIDIQDVYDATCTLAVVQAGSCSPLSQRIFFLSSAQQIIHQPKNTRGNRTDVDQTILAFLDENGNITKQIVYEGGLAVSIADLNAKVAANVLTLSQTIHFIEDAPIVVKPALGMAISDISPLPGAVFEASIGSGATTTWNGRGMDFVFDTTVQGFAAGGFAYNDTALGDFSSVQQLAFGIQRTGGNVGEMFFTVEDSDGDKVSMRVTELNTSEQILAFSIADLVRLNPELDLNKIKIMFFEVQGSNLIGGFKINRIANPVQGGILHSNNALDLRDIQSVANDYTALDVFGTGASATTMKSSRGINLTYNTGTGAGPFSGGFASYAPAADFSTLNQLVVGVEGISGNTDRIKIEIEDNIGNKSHVYIDDIIDGKESVFSISMESFLGSANLSEIKAMLFIVEGAGKSGEVNINFEPTIVTIPRAQLIEDHKNNQTLKATMAADGVTIIRQDVYKGIHSTLGALVRAELIQQVITDGDEQLLIDPVRNQTVHGFLNDDEEFVQQDVYTGVYYAFADLDPLKLIQRIYFLLDDPHTQLMQTFGTGPNGEDQTIMVTLGADGKTTTRHDIYNNVLADELSDLDIGNPYQSVIFISDTEQLLQVHSYGVTFQRIFDPVTFLLTEEHIYPGIINTTDDTNLSILQSTYVISETQRIVLDFTVQPFAQTIVFTFDEDGYVVMRKIYDELPPLGTLDVSGMLLLMTVIPLDETRTMILQHANHVYVPTDQILYPNETWIEHVSFADPNNPVLLRRDVYDGIIPDPADLPADPNTLVFFPAPNVILVKDRDSDQTVVTTYGTQTCVDIYSDVKYDTYDGTLTWDLTVTGLEHLSQSCS
jgi:hypothetical protein